MTTENDCWGAFGSDEEDDESDAEMGEENLPAASEAALFLTKSFLHDNSKISIGERRIGIFAHDDADGPKNHSFGAQAWSDTLEQRGFGTVSILAASDSANHNKNGAMYDAIVVLVSLATTELQAIRELQDKAHDRLVPGGFMLVAHSTVPASSTSATNGTFEIGSLLQMDLGKWSHRSPSSENPNNNINNNENQEAALMELIFQSNDTRVVVLQKRLCQIQERSCLWLSSKHSIAQERQRAEEATVVLSAHEIESGQMTEPSIVKAVEKMKDHGYCIIPRLLDAAECLEWGHAVLSDLHSASKILVEREGVDLFHPHSSKKDPQSYRELSMREDLRMDLRDGPRIRQLRGRGGGENNSNNKPIVLKGSQMEPEDVSATTPATPATSNGHESAANPFFRQNPSVLEVVRRTMNPRVGNLYKGNFGRYNFSGGGPDGSFQDIRLSAVGGIVSLPGSADQALHADTPHLFEHATLPAHYINAFTPGCSGDSLVGCTAFVNGSHKIEFTAQYLAEDVGHDNSNGNSNGGSSQHPSSAASGDNHNAVFHFLARPQLELGDVVLFDCRTLHFGLANMSKSVERPLLYCNMTHAWFTDPKNWDDHHPVFEDL